VFGMTQEAPRPRTVAAAIALTSLVLVVALSPLATWAVRTYDFGLEQRVAGTRLGGWVLVALGVLVVAAGVLAMVGSRRSGTMALLAGSAAFIFAIVRAVQLDGQDFAVQSVTIEGSPCGPTRKWFLARNVELTGERLSAMIRQVTP
jgi:hypothetical protein